MDRQTDKIGDMMNRYNQTIQIATRKDGQADDEQTDRQIRQKRKWTDRRTRR